MISVSVRSKAPRSVNSRRVERVVVRNAFQKPTGLDSRDDFRKPVRLMRPSGRAENSSGVSQ